MTHLQGLEQTSQFIPDYAGWHEGAFCLNGPEYPQTYERVIEDLSQWDNIGIVVEDVHKLTEPEEFEIGKISAVHIDVDIYEPTVSSLKFVDKWEWIEKNNYTFELLRNGLHGEMIVSR